MKKVILFTALFLSLLLVKGASSQDMNLRNSIPDVMNNVNLIHNTPMGIKSFTLSLDSFPVFPGFPKAFQYTTFEGNIYCNMDGDPDLEVVFNIGYTVQALNKDGSNVPGWPKTVASYTLEGAPSFGDIDGDGQGEIVVTNHGLTSGGYIYAFKKDGTPVSGFPINHGYSLRTPVLADVNGDNKLDIIVNLRTYPTGKVYVYKYDGTVLPGWPKNIGHVPASSAAVGDIDGDNSPEIVMESYTGLYVWKANGDSLPGFPFMMPNGDVNSYSSPVIADVDGDNFKEIIFGTHVSGAGGYVYVLNKNGSVLPGWPKQTNYWIYGPPGVGYIDGDNLIDIAVGDQALTGSPVLQLYAWNKNGVALSGFPVSGLWAINSQPVLLDLDGDNNTEIVIDDNTQTGGIGKYLAFNHDGTPVAGWPKDVSGTTFFKTPSFGDIDRNGILDMIGSGTVGSGNTAVTNVYVWNTQQAINWSKLQIPMWQYNSRHNGVYGDIIITGLSNLETEVPSTFSLEQNYPNPFNPITKIKFQVPLCHSGVGRNPNVILKVFDILGKEVATLVNESLQPGTYEVTFDAASLSSGVYFYKITTGDFSAIRKMVLVR
jgi:hypothetical protein